MPYQRITSFIDGLFGTTIKMSNLDISESEMEQAPKMNIFVDSDAITNFQLFNKVRISFGNRIIKLMPKSRRNVKWTIYLFKIGLSKFHQLLVYIGLFIIYYQTVFL